MPHRQPLSVTNRPRLRCVLRFRFRFRCPVSGSGSGALASLGLGPARRAADSLLPRAHAPPIGGEPTPHVTLPLFLVTLVSRLSCHRMIILVVAVVGCVCWTALNEARHYRAVGTTLCLLVAAIAASVVALATALYLPRIFGYLLGMVLPAQRPRTHTPHRRPRLVPWGLDHTHPPLDLSAVNSHRPPPKRSRNGDLAARGGCSSAAGLRVVLEVDWN